MKTSHSLFGGEEGSWFKGALHCHSTESDGNKSPGEVATWYRSQSYDFMSLTDHCKITQIQDDAGLLCIPGVELNTRGTRENKIGLYHVVGVGVDAMCDCSVHDDPQLLIDAIVAAGGLAIIAHPKWSGNVVDREFVELQNYVGIECFNYACQIDNNTGLADIHWDMLTLHGKQVFGFATDDAHWHIEDGGGGWVMVKAKALTQDAILDAIRNGHFYSSSGPVIHDVTFDGETISVSCSPAAAIHFMTGGPLGQSYWADVGAHNRLGSNDSRDPESDQSLLTEASYKVRGSEPFIRVEVVDRNNRVAWTQPFKLTPSGSSSD